MWSPLPAGDIFHHLSYTTHHTHTTHAHTLHAHTSGIARPSGLDGHTYRWVSVARLGEDQTKKGHNFPSRRCQFVARILHFKLSSVCLLYTTAIESGHCYISKVGPPRGYTTGTYTHAHTRARTHTLHTVQDEVWLMMSLVM